MNIKRGFNKKAQEGMSTGTLAAIVLVVVVVVLLIMGLSGALNPIFDKFNLFPGSGVAGVVQACQGYVQVSSKADFCAFREVKIGSSTEYINCMDARVNADMSSDTKNSGITCDQSSIRTECISLIEQGKQTSLVDSTNCISFTDIDCKVDLKGLSGTNCPVDQSSASAPYTKKITSGFVGASSTNVCCIIP